MGFRPLKPKITWLFPERVLITEYTGDQCLKRLRCHTESSPASGFHLNLTKIQCLMSYVNCFPDTVRFVIVSGNLPPKMRFLEVTS